MHRTKASHRELQHLVAKLQHRPTSGTIASAEPLLAVSYPMPPGSVTPRSRPSSAGRLLRGGARGAPPARLTLPLPLPLPPPLPPPLPLTPTQVQHSPDFATMSEADALADLQLRIEHYEKIYDTVREEEGAYIKMFDLRAKARV